MTELLEQQIKELEEVILTINSILDEAKNFFKPISSDIHKQIKI